MSDNSDVLHVLRRMEAKLDCLAKGAADEGPPAVTPDLPVSLRDALPELDIREELARIDRRNAETRKFIEESRQTQSAARMAEDRRSTVMIVAAVVVAFISGGGSVLLLWVLLHGH